MIPLIVYELVAFVDVVEVGQEVDADLVVAVLEADDEVAAAGPPLAVAGVHSLVGGEAVA